MCLFTFKNIMCIPVAEVFSFEIPSGGTCLFVGHGQGGVDEEFGDAEFAEFFQNGEAAEGDEAFAAVVDGDHVLFSTNGFKPFIQKRFLLVAVAS